MKFREYESAGVSDYWIIDSRPSKQRADFYRLDNRNRFELFATEDDEIVRTTSLVDFWLRPARLWQEPTPNLLPALGEVVGWETLIGTLQQAAAEDVNDISLGNETQDEEDNR